MCIRLTHACVHGFLFTQGPPAYDEAGAPTGSPEGSPLSAHDCPATWGVLEGPRGLNLTAHGHPDGYAPPRAWREGEAPNVLRRGRLALTLSVYRSDRFGAQPFGDGERREACLAPGQRRTYSIFSASPLNSTLCVAVDAPPIAPLMNS